MEVGLLAGEAIGERMGERNKAEFEVQGDGWGKICIPCQSHRHQDIPIILNILELGNLDVYYVE